MFTNDRTNNQVKTILVHSFSFCLFSPLFLVIYSDAKTTNNISLCSTVSIQCKCKYFGFFSSVACCFIFRQASLSHYRSGYVPHTVEHFIYFINNVFTYLDYELLIYQFISTDLHWIFSLWPRKILYLWNISVRCLHQCSYNRWLQWTTANWWLRLNSVILTNFLRS